MVGFTRNGCWNKYVKLFLEFHVKSVISRTMLIVSCAQNGCFEEVVTQFLFIILHKASPSG